MIGNRLTRYILTLLAMAATLTVGAQQSREYTESHPLIIVTDWDSAPYEFRNNNGQPDGYNVEVMRAIFRQMGIPCTFVMKDWQQATELFEKREADIILDSHYKYHGRPYMMGRTILGFYKVKVAMRQGVPPLHQLSQLTENDTLVLKHNSYEALRIKNERQLETPIEYHSATEALTGLASGKYKYFICGEERLKWKMREFHIDSLIVADIDIPSGETHIIGYDKELIDDIDDQYARLEQKGELERIHDKWFYPERVHNDTSPVALLVLAGVIIISLTILLMSRLIRVRVKAAIHKSVDLNKMMIKALEMGNYYVTECDLETGHVKNQYGNLLPDSGMTLEEFISRISPEEQEGFRKEIEKMRNGESRQWTLRKHWNAGTPEEPQWKCLHGKAITEEEEGKVRYIVNTVKDITRDVEEERLNNELGSKYMRMFDTSLVAMSFYNSEGVLIDLNEKMKELTELNEETEKYYRATKLTDVPIFKSDFDLHSHEDFHVCHKMHHPQASLRKYIEFRIHPIFDDNDELIYYALTARDITAERDMYLELRKHTRELEDTHSKIDKYEQQLRYLLENSETFTIQVKLKERTISFSRSLKSVYSQTFDEYLDTLPDEDKEEALKALTTPHLEPFNVIRHMKRTMQNDKPSWSAISCMPTFDKDGNLTGYFGISRNITQLVAIQQKLKEETARAEDSGRLKSAFLANMTHEIRTPLNAIVGFSDILQVVDTKEERMEFIRIIRNNCDMLLRLINDILEASSMGQALAIEPVDIDLSQVFNDICQTLAQRVQEPGVEFIKDNPYDSFQAHLDKGRVQQVLTNFTTNAVKYTHQGHIKVGYREQDGGIYFYCEDTGAGIPKEKQAAVFERFVKLNDFVQGTGLGLSICKSIADRCGGKIGVFSEGEGHGSTFWMWIPREVRLKNE